MPRPRSSQPRERPARKRPWRRAREGECSCCSQIVPFCWSCQCGLCICQACMAENRWGLTCNNIHWQCPDCGKWHGYGNA